MDFEFRRPQSAKASLKRIAVLLGVIGAAFIVSQLFGLVAAGILAATGTARQSVAGYGLSVISQGAAFITVTILYLNSQDLRKIVPVETPNTDDVRWMIGGFILIVLIASAAGIIVETLGVETAENQITEVGDKNPTLYLLLIPLSFIAVGTSEELLFRGLVQKRLEPFFGTGGAVVAGCSIFAAAHVFALQGTIAGIMTTIGVLFVVSTVFGVAYAATDNILVPIFIHGAYNATIFAMLYIAATADIPSVSQLLLLL